eukprot:scaffold159671_cov34-Tisochrysis_lutea.AAC.5
MTPDADTRCNAIDLAIARLTAIIQGQWERICDIAFAAVNTCDVHHLRPVLAWRVPVSTPPRLARTQDAWRRRHRRRAARRLPRFGLRGGRHSL